MKPIKRNLLLIIVVNIILGLIIIVIPMRLWGCRQVITKETITRETRLEDELTQSIQNFKELEEIYLELKRENMELKEQSDIIWDKFKITFYTQNDAGCNNLTAIGLDLNKDWTKHFNFVAVDPDVIPYGKTIFIKIDGKIIEALAVDCGYAIKGNRLDLYCGSLEEAFSFGIKEDVPVGVIK